MGIKKDYNFSYKKSGVDVKKADKLLDKVKPLIASTKGKNNLGDIGGFGGLFKINSKQYKNPLLVAATDGVGSKLLIAKQLNNFNTIGIDLVAMSVNDVIVQGARPLFFLDYLAIDKLKENMFIDIIKGIVNSKSRELSIEELLTVKLSPRPRQHHIASATPQQSQAKESWYDSEDDSLATACHMLQLGSSRVGLTAGTSAVNG